MLADGILVGPELSGHRLADQDCAGAARPVGIVKLASAQQGDVQRAHVAGADQTHIYFWLVGHRHDRPAFRLYRLMRAAGERQGVDETG